ELTLLAVGVTALATAATALMAAVWRWRDRTAADWIATGSWSELDELHPGDGTVVPVCNATATLANVGDGPAYRVWVMGAGCSADVVVSGETGWNNGLIPVLNPGDTLKVQIHGELDGWETSEVVIAWSPPPTRRRRRWLGLRSNRRHQWIPTQYVAPLPTSFDGPRDLRGEPSKWRFVRWRDGLARRWRAWRYRSRL